MSTPPAPAATASQVASSTGNVSVIAGGATSSPGPEKLTFGTCGNLSAAQQAQFGTTASAGLTYAFVNGSAGLAAPKVEVNFLDGTTVVASNVSGAGLDPIGPGQSGSGEVDAVGDSGQDVTFTSCQVTGYAVVGSDGVGDEYAG